MPTPFDPELVLSKPLMAHLATVALDGTPRNAPVWFHWENASLWMLGSAGNSSTQRLIENPACAVEIVDYDNTVGILRHLGLRGRATVEPNDPDLFHRLLNRYLGAPDTWNPWFIEQVAMINAPTSRMIKLIPDSIFTNDVSFFRTGPELATPPDQKATQ